MSLGSKVYYHIATLHGFLYALSVTDIPMDEFISVKTFKIIQALARTSVCEEIQINYRIGRMSLKPGADEVRTYEAGSARYQKLHRHNRLGSGLWAWGSAEERLRAGG